MIWLLAQISPRTDMFFRAILIPGGVLIASIGLRAIRQQRFYLFRHLEPIQGRGATFWGVLVILAGIACSAVSLASFFQ